MLAKLRFKNRCPNSNNIVSLKKKLEIFGRALAGRAIATSPRSCLTAGFSLYPSRRELFLEVILF